MGKGRKGASKKQRIIFVVIPLAIAAVALFFWVSRPIKPEREARPPVVRFPVPPVEKKEAEEKGEKEEAEKKPEVTQPPSFPRLAFIIDDVGYNKARLNGMMGTGRPMTFAILPHTPHARQSALTAHQNGAEVMLHLPMEPKESEHYTLEKHTLRAGMSRGAVQEILKDDLRDIPFVRGVNNHMGSKATEDPVMMQALMEVLGQEKLYYIDSYTSPHTMGPRMARRCGVRYGKNAIFLDRENKLPAIKAAIYRVMKKAQREGKAVAIGHPHPLTAQAIKEMIPEIEREGIKLVFASEVVR